MYLIDYVVPDSTLCSFRGSHCQQQQSYSGLRHPDDQTQPFESTLLYLNGESDC